MVASFFIFLFIYRFSHFQLATDRMREGREKAKEKGVHLGSKGQDAKAIKRALKLYQERENNRMSIAVIVRTTGVPKSSLYAEMKKQANFS